MIRRKKSPYRNRMRAKGVSKKAWYRRFWGWTGFGEKKLWDWLQLLVIPIVLAGGALLFNASQSKIEQEIARETREEAALDE